MTPEDDDENVIRKAIGAIQDNALYIDNDPSRDTLRFTNEPTSAGKSSCAGTSSPTRRPSRTKSRLPSSGPSSPNGTKGPATQCR